MQRTFLKAKIHRATITAADLNYVGSLGIDTDLMRAAGIEPYEQLHVVNVSNGERLVTYAIPASAGQLTLNGAAARRGAPGDVVIVMTFAELDPAEIPTHEPTVILVDSKNRAMGRDHSVTARI
jgi:aspartate 1-decarboxylase